jgi:hypothetical protein
MDHEDAGDARAAGIVLPTVGPLGATLRFEMRGSVRLFSFNLRVDDSYSGAAAAAGRGGASSTISNVNEWFFAYDVCIRPVWRW